MMPGRRLMADISEQMIDQVKVAVDGGRALNIVGGSSKSFMGREAVGEPLNVGQHSGIVNYEPVELVLTARAGTSISTITKALDAEGQMLAFEPPTFGGSSTIGGTLACNMSGPARPWCGSVRDATLGVRLINGKAEHLRFGGQVMKNVAGYDVSRLQSGAMGALGVITEISLKVMPKPEYEITLMQDIDMVGAITLMNKLAGRSLPITGACWYGGTQYLRLSGSGKAVSSAVEKLGGECDEKGTNFWQSLREYELPFFTGSPLIWRFSVKPTAPPMEDDNNCLIDWGGAQRWHGTQESGQESEKALFEQAAIEASGQASLFRGGDRSGEVFQALPTRVADIHKGMKQAFDPAGIFNPGRSYSWL